MAAELTEEELKKGQSKALIITAALAVFVLLVVAGAILIGPQVPLYTALALTPLYIAGLSWLAVTPDPDA